MRRTTPRLTRTDPLFPYSTLFRSCGNGQRTATLGWGAAIPQLRHSREGGNPVWGQPTHALDSRLRGNDKVIKRRSEEHTSELQSLMRISSAVFCLNKNKLQKSAGMTLNSYLANHLNLCACFL